MAQRMTGDIEGNIDRRIEENFLKIIFDGANGQAIAFF